MLLNKEWLEEIEGYGYLRGSEAYPTLRPFCQASCILVSSCHTAVSAMGGSSLNAIYAFEKIGHVHLKQGVFPCTKCILKTTKYLKGYCCPSKDESKVFICLRSAEVTKNQQV